MHISKHDIKIKNVHKMTLVYFDNKVYSNSIHPDKAYRTLLFLYPAGIYQL